MTSQKLNIVLFGPSGVGKSSIVNMLGTNENAARTSGWVKGCTLESQSFDIAIRDHSVVLWDTPGFDEGDEVGTPNVEAVAKLYKLLLDLKEGVSLLVLVMRAERIKQSAPANWNLFRNIICDEKVPMALIITGLESEGDRQNWWFQHKGSFQQNGIPTSEVAGVACITASRGGDRWNGEHVFDDQYEKSRKQVEELILDTALAHPVPVRPVKWFTETYKKLNQWDRAPLGLNVAFKKLVKKDGDASKKMRAIPGFPNGFIEKLRQRLETM